MRFITLLATLTILTPPASAQFGNPAGMDPGTCESAPGVPVPRRTNVPDRLFAALAAQGGMAEVELGKLAQQKSRNHAVTAFAKRMVDDHGNSNAQLAELAKQTGLLLPTEPAPDQLEVRQRLSALKWGSLRRGIHACTGDRPSKDGAAPAVGDRVRGKRRFAALCLRHAPGRSPSSPTRADAPKSIDGCNRPRDELTSGALKGRHETSEP